MKRAWGAVLVLLLPAIAWAELCDQSKKFCGYWPGSSSSSGGGGAPTRGGKIKINPAAVPIDKSTGIEAIIFDGAEFSIVRGFGRVGAGISMSNSEDTFFGAPGIELPDDYRERHDKKQKYESQKFTLASAFQIFSNKKSSMKQFDMNLGLMGKYNKDTKHLNGGSGLSGKLGPFTYGYALYTDETRLNYSRYGVSNSPTTSFLVETVSLGLFLHSVALDYAILRQVTNDTWTTKVLTASLLLKRTILTLSQRTEVSTRPQYDYTSKVLENREQKKELFAGVQANIGKYFLGGVFYNYYMLHEISFGLTVFF